MSSYYDDEEEVEEEYEDEDDMEDDSETSSVLSKSFNNSEYSFNSSSQIGSIMNHDIDKRYIKRLSM